jgi:hypothetical protein
MSVHVRTQRGYVTSYREAWKDDAGKPVWTWRTDGPEPHDFGTVAAAEAWIDDVLHLLTAKERASEPWAIEAS